MDQFDSFQFDGRERKNNAVSHQKTAYGGENEVHAVGVPEVIRTPDLSLRSSKNLVFNRVPVCSVMSEKPWNIKDSG